MTEAKKCARCGQAIPAGAGTRLCSGCALADALQEPAVEACGPTLLLDDIPKPGQALGMIGDYHVIEVIGCGGMGVVYKARQARLDRVVALKVLPGGAFAREEAKRRFLQEAQAVAQLRHPNIVPIYDLGEAGGQLYFSLEYVAGRDLGQAIRDKPFEPRRAAKCIKAVAEAVQHAHSQDVFHRDLKPSNILLGEDDEPKITDFGLALRGQTSAELTATGHVLGSPGYMAPEQVESGQEKTGAWTDVYGARATLYALLTGRAPFTGNRIEALLRELLTVEPVGIRRLNPSVPSDLETICLKCLEKEPGRRYPTAGALAEDLGRFLEGQAIRAKPVSPGRRLAKWCGRNPGSAALSAALIFALVGGLGATLSQWRRAEQSRGETRRANATLVSKIEELQIRRAESLFSGGDASSAIRGLAEVVEANPSNEVAAARLVSALSHRRFMRPLWRFSHPEMVWVEMDRNGRHVVTGDANGKVLLWDGLSGQPLSAALSHPGLSFLALSAAGDRVATCGAGGQVRLWGVPQGEEIRELRQPGPVTMAGFSPDGRFLACADQSGGLCVWELSSSSLRWRANEHSRALTAIRYSPDGKLMLTTSLDHTARIWDLASGQLVGPVLQHDPPVTDGAFSPDGLSVATTASAFGYVWKVGASERRQRAFGHDGEAVTVRFSPDGATLLTGTWDGMAVQWDVRTGQRLTPPLHHGARVHSAEFGPEGTSILTAGDDHYVRLWDAASGVALAEPFAGSDWIQWARPAGAGNEWIVAFSDGAVLRLALSSTMPPVVPRMLGHWMNRARASADGRWVVLCSPDVDGEVWDTDTGTMATALPHGGHVLAASLTADGSRAITCGEDGCAQLWEARTGRRLGPVMKHPNQLSYGEFSPDGRQVALGCLDGTLYIRDPGDGRLIAELPGSRRDPIRLRYSTDGRFLAMASPPGELSLWHLGPRIEREARRWKAGTAIEDLAFSPLGNLLATAGTDRTVTLWNVETGERWAEPLKHPGVVVALNFDASGRRLVTAASDRAIRVWDVRSGLSLSEPLYLNLPPKLAQFLPGGDQILAISGDVQGQGSAAWFWHEPAPRAPASRLLLEAARRIGDSRPPAAGVGHRPAREVSSARQGEGVGGRDDFYDLWSAWLGQPSSQRSVAWDSSISATQLLREATLKGLVTDPALVVQGLPGDGIVLAELAEGLMRSKDPNAAGRADFLSRRATELAPQSEAMWEKRAGVLAGTDQARGAVEAFARASELATADLALQLREIRFLSRIGQGDAARVKADRLLERAARLPDASHTLPEVHLARAALALQASQCDRYLEERLAAYGIPARASNLDARMVDLGAYCNASLKDDWQNPADQGNNLAELPAGPVEIGGLRWDIRGLIQLNGISLGSLNPCFPERVGGIRVDLPCARIHLLVGTGWWEEEGAVIARCLFRRSNGSTNAFEIAYGRHVRDWAFSPESGPEPGLPRPIWKGTQARWRDRSGWGTRLYLCTWTNPQPGSVVEALDFVSTMSRAAPFLVAITVE